MQGWTPILCAVALAAMLVALLGKDIEVAGVKLPGPSTGAARGGLFAFGLFVAIAAVALAYFPPDPAKPAELNPAARASPSPVVASQPAATAPAAQNATVAIAKGKGNVALANSSVGGDIEVTVQ